MSTATQHARQERLTRIKSNQVLCNITGCGNAATFVLHRDLRSAKPARLAYCEQHATAFARDFDIRMPEPS